MRLPLTLAPIAMAALLASPALADTMTLSGTGTVRAAPDMLRVEFRDNGTPIPDAARALIFEKFARVAEGDGSGAGLGLAICREIMARLGGDISHVPQASGNLFVVQMPRAAALAAQ